MSRARWILLILSFGATLSVTAVIVRAGMNTPGEHPVLPLWAHGAALTAVLLEVVTRSVKIKWAAAALRIKLRFWTAVRVCLGGDFAAAITPARSGAEPARFLILVEGGTTPAPALLILFAELLLESWSLVLFSLAFAFLFQDQGPVINLMTTLIIGYAAVVLGIGAAAYSLAHRGSRGPPPPWALALGLHAGRWRAVQRALRALRANFAAFRHAAPGPMAAAFVASLFHVALRLVVLVIVARALDPSQQMSTLALWSLVLLYGGAVAPAPGGGGAVEFGFRFAFRNSMTPAVLGGALLWWRFYSFYLYAMLGAVAVGRTVFRALRAPRHGRLHERAQQGHSLPPHR